MVLNCIQSEKSTDTKQQLSFETGCYNFIKMMENHKDSGWVVFEVEFIEKYHFQNAGTYIRSSKIISQDNSPIIIHENVYEISADTIFFDTTRNPAKYQYKNDTLIIGFLNMLFFESYYVEMDCSDF